MKINLDGKLALVTGASRGIGKAIARDLGMHGASIIGTATTSSGVEMINSDFKDLDINGKGMVLDVADTGSIESLFKELSDAEQTPLILVNNAGITRDNLMMRMKDSEWNEVINTNLNSVYQVTRHCLKGMMKARNGRIINITSVVALSGNPGQVNYSAAKAGMIGFTKSLAREIGSRCITVNAIAPGFIVTDMTDQLTEDQKSEMTRQVALGRLGEIQEVASVVSFLASDCAAYITGETINVNGGLYMA
jgi:3-oxoacyl-[acyl-carrier protein] reductase